MLPNGNLKYNSQSPDETALVQAAKNFGFVFKERTQESLTLEACTTDESHCFKRITHEALCKHGTYKSK